MIGLSYRLVVVGVRSCSRTDGRHLEQPETRSAGVSLRGIRERGPHGASGKFRCVYIPPEDLPAGTAPFREKKSKTLPGLSLA